MSGKDGERTSNRMIASMLRRFSNGTSALFQPLMKSKTVIFDLIQVQAGLAAGPRFEDLWWTAAYDPQGELQAYGLGLTPTEARAHAWISVWWEGYDSREALHVVPRIVPEGWRFELYPPGGPMFRSTGAQPSDVDSSSQHWAPHSVQLIARKHPPNATQESQR